MAFVQQATSWLTTIAAGYLGDRFSNKASLILAASLTLMGVSSFLLGYAPNYWVVLAVMLLVGVGPGLYHPPALGALSRKFPYRRGFAVSLHGTGGSIGEVLGPLVAAGALIFLMWQDVLRASPFPRSARRRRDLDHDAERFGHIFRQGGFAPLHTLRPVGPTHRAPNSATPLACCQASSFVPGQLRARDCFFGR